MQPHPVLLLLVFNFPECFQSNYNWNLRECSQSRHSMATNTDRTFNYTKYLRLLEVARLQMITCRGFRELEPIGQGNKCELLPNTTVDVNSLSSALIHLTHQVEEWTQFIIIYTASYENLVQNILIEQTYQELSFEYKIHYTYDHNKEFTYSNVSQQLVELFTEINQRKEMRFLILAEAEVQQILLEVVNEIDWQLNQQGYFSYMHRWLLFFDRQDKLSDIQTALHEVQHVTAVTLDDCGKLVIYSGMWKPEGRRFETTGTFQDYVDDYHYMEQQNQIVDDKMTLFPNVKYGFNGKLMRVSSQTFAIYTITKTDSQGRNVYSGMYVDLLGVLAGYFNFTYNFTVAPGGLWGSKIDGVWNGVVGMVHYGEADLALAAMTTTPERETAMDFAPIPITQEKVAAIYRTPKPLENTLFIYFSIFHQDIWIIVSVVLVSYPLFMWGLNYMWLKDKRVMKPLEIWEEVVLTYLNALASSVSEAVGVRSLSQSYQSVLWMTWWVYSFILISVWSGNLFSFSAVQLYPDLIEDISEIHLQNKYALGTQASTAILEIMPTTSNEIMRNLYEKMMSDFANDPEVLEGDTKIHMRKVLTEDYIFIVDAAEPLRDEYNCTLTVIPGTIMPINYYLGMQKNSAYKEIMNNFILKTAQTGLHQFWNKKYIKDSDACNTDDSNNQVLKFVNFIPVLICFCGIMATAVLILGVENGVHFLEKRRKNLKEANKQLEEEHKNVTSFYFSHYYLERV